MNHQVHPNTPITNVAVLKKSLLVDYLVNSCSQESLKVPSMNREYNSQPTSLSMAAVAGLAATAQLPPISQGQWHHALVLGMQSGTC